MDGELIQTQAIPAGDTPGTPTEIWVGGSPESGRWVKGIIDEVAFFNVALGEDDIKDIMNNGLPEALGITAVEPGGKLTTIWGAIKH